jgi:hypothetical protein
MGVFENRRFLRKSEKKLFSQKNPKKIVQKNSIVNRLIDILSLINLEGIFELEKSKFSSLETFFIFIYAKIYAKKFSSINIIKINIL